LRESKGEEKAGRKNIVNKIKNFVTHSKRRSRIYLEGREEKKERRRSKREEKRW